MHFVTVKKSKKSSGFDSDLFIFIDSAFIAIKRDAKFLTKYVKKVPFLTEKYTKGVPFLPKMVYKRVNIGAVAPRIELC